MIEGENIGGLVTSAPIPLESFRSVHVEMYYLADGVSLDAESVEAIPPLARGSAFFFKIEGIAFVVSARHNFAGRHWETNKVLSTRGVEPTHVRVRFRERPDGSLYTQPELRLDEYLLPLVDDNGEPNWLEHPEYRRRMDVAVLAFEPPEENEVEFWLPETSGSGIESGVWVAQDVFIVGYPFGQRGALDLPLWIRGTVASEPALHYLHKDEPLPVLLVDARTRTGQSGAPVVILNRRFADDTVEHLGTPRSRLVGVYTGRISDDAISVSYGEWRRCSRCWAAQHEAPSSSPMPIVGGGASRFVNSSRQLVVQHSRQCPLGNAHPGQRSWRASTNQLTDPLARVPVD
jgi:hypothetical protein